MLFFDRTGVLGLWERKEQIFNIHFNVLVFMKKCKFKKKLVSNEFDKTNHSHWNDEWIQI